MSNLFLMILIAPFTPAVPPGPFADESMPVNRVEEPKKDSPALKRSMVPTEAFALAALDARTLSVEDRLFTRYLWQVDPTPIRIESRKFGLATLERSSDPINPTVLADGHLIRVNLSKYYPRIDDLQTAIDTWELLQFDPSSALLLTRDQAEFFKQRGEEDAPKVQIRRQVKPKKKPTAKDQDTMGPMPPEIDIVVPTNEIFEMSLASEGFEFPSDVNVIRINGPHIDPAVFLELQQSLGTVAPVVDAEYFFRRSMTTVQDAGLYKDLYGGLYYQLSGIRTAKQADPKSKLTDLDQLFKDLGLGENAADLFERLRSDQRILLGESSVTGKPRVIVFYPTSTVGEGRLGYVVFTIDLQNQDIDIRKRPVLNLLNPQAAAFEVIWVGSDGLPRFAIFDAKGTRLDQVGQDIAADRTIPSPHTPILEPGRGCIACHCASGSSLLIDAVNELPPILKLKDRGDIYADLGDKKKPISDTLDRLKVYSRKTGVLFQRGRDDFNAAVLESTFSTRIMLPKELLEYGKMVSGQLISDYNQQRYGRIDATVALRELGFVAETKEQAIATLNTLLPPDHDSVIYGVAIEDPRVLTLLAGLAIQRTDWDLIRSYASYQSQRVLSKLPKDNPMRMATPNIPPMPDKPARKLELIPVNPREIDP